ncbi:HNH endonuclease [Bradyrhizobium sp. ORS 86]|uniref:HNH endonuclease n=1 Tax=Bradyrhizobium sp. ORS 86 TaxID=1685970 RepID=UPI00388F7B76
MNVFSRVSEQAWLRAFRVEAVTEQRGACAYCHCPLTKRTATADHRRSRKAGGTTERENIKAACLDCNSLKGAMSVNAFKALIKNPKSGDDIRVWLAWSRRRMFLAAERSCARIMRAAA